ncbi:30S ribosomal protein THX [Odoribacter sp. OttesenSCG-928-L07]|nr:30S ribosomal protein THX [Odoribacter sp. OttesenSCG-928-L07]MDL2240456.1 30S ribosomal protein THX [Bacteroidales bacterium OttesenSCG-928-K22]
MGKGDKKTKRGKLILGSYGNKRSRKDNKSVDGNKEITE